VKRWQRWSLLTTLIVSSCAHDLSGHPSVAPDGVDLASIPHPTSSDPSTGDPSISREALLRILAEGPGAILRQLRLTPHRNKDQFIGYRLGAVPPELSAAAKKPQVGDILLRVNGMRVLMPSDLMVLWKHLQEATRIEMELSREQAPYRWSLSVID